MDELEQSDLEKETNDFFNTFNRNAKHCKKEKSSNKRIISVVHSVLSLLEN